jgi:hypothetical protein
MPGLTLQAGLFSSRPDPSGNPRSGTQMTQRWKMYADKRTCKRQEQTDPGG